MPLYNLTAFREVYLHDPGQDICFYSVTVVHLLQHRGISISISISNSNVSLAAKISWIHDDSRCNSVPIQVSKENRNAILPDILSALHDCLKQSTWYGEPELYVG